MADLTLLRIEDVEGGPGSVHHEEMFETSSSHRPKKRSSCIEDSDVKLGSYNKNEDKNLEEPGVDINLES